MGGVAVGGAHGVGQHQLLARRQVIECFAGRIEGPVDRAALVRNVDDVAGIHAQHRLQGGIERDEAGAHAGCGHRNDARRDRVAQVDVSHAQRAGGGQRAVGFRQSPGGAVAADDADAWRIFGAGDGDADSALDNAAMAVIDLDVELFDFGLARSQVFHRTVGHRVGPGQLAARAAVGRVSVLDGRKSTQWRADRHGRDRVHVRQVNIGEGECSRIRQVAGRRDLFRHRAGNLGCAHQRRIIGAGDGDRQCRGGGAAATVVDRVRKCIAQDFPGCQLLYRRLGIVERVGITAVGGDDQRAVAGAHAAAYIAAQGPALRVRLDPLHRQCVGILVGVEHIPARGAGRRHVARDARDVARRDAFVH